MGNIKKLDYFFRYTFIFSLMFFVAYLLIFFQVFTVHDYYLSNLMIFPVITFFCMSNILSQNNLIYNNKIVIRYIIFILVFFNAFYSAAYYRLRMIKNDNLCAWYPLVSQEDRNYSNWLLWHRKATTEPLETITPELRRAGIKRTDLFLALPDESFNISLYLMDQKGETIPAFDYNDTTKLPSIMAEKKYAYLVLIDASIKSQKAFAAISDRLEPFMVKEHIEIFKIKK